MKEADGNLRRKRVEEGRERFTSRKPDAGFRNMKSKCDKKVVFASDGCCLTWVAWGALGQSNCQIGQLAAMVTVFQRADVHAAPPAKLPEPETFLLGFTVGVQYDAHPQGPCTQTHIYNLLLHPAAR